MVHGGTNEILLQLDLVVGILTLVVGLAILRILVTSELDVLTSRIFLKKERFQKYFSYFIYLVILSSIAMGIQHLLEYLNATGVIDAEYEITIGLIHLASMIFVFASVTVWYKFLRELDLNAEKVSE